MYGTLAFYFHYKLGQVSKNNNFVFFSFVVRPKLVIIFYSQFFVYWLDSSPTSVFPAEETVFSSSSCNLILFSGENSLLFGRRPSRVIEFACFDSKLQLARNTCERKQDKRHNVCRALCHNTTFIFVTYVPQIPSLLSVVSHDEAKMRSLLPLIFASS